VVNASTAGRLATLSAEAEAQGFRIVQEALTNVRKHSGASRVDINVSASGEQVVVEVCDDGRGLDDQIRTASDWPHYGRTTMAARAAEVGGTVEWLSTPGGTTVRLRVPLARAHAAATSASAAGPSLTVPPRSTDAVAGRVPVADARP
jgi:signal transduction histidine kinase